MTMPKSKSTRRPSAPANCAPINQLVNPDLPYQTIEHCTSVLEYVRQASVAGQNYGTEMGRFLVLGLVTDALAHAQSEMQRQRREVSRG
jgi:hypothetical protein